MTDEPRPKARRFSWRNGFLIAAALAALWGILGALILPGYFRGRLEKLVREQTNGSLSVGRLTVNPFLLAVGIHDFALYGPGRDTLLTAGAFVIDASVMSVFAHGVILDRIALLRPNFHLTIEPGGVINWAKLLKNAPDTSHAARPDSGASMPPLRIRQLTLTSGQLFFQDLSRSTPYATTIAPINFRLDHFSTLPNEKEDHSFTASLKEGGTLRWQGRSSVTPPVAIGRIEVDSLSARALWRWMSSELRFEVPTGRIFLGLSYAIAARGDSAQIRIHDGTLKVNDLRIVEPGRKEDVIALPSLGLEGAALDFTHSTASVSRVHAEGARLVGSLSPDTVFSFAKLFELRHPPAPAKGPPPPPWRVKLDQFDVSGVSASITDSTQRHPPTLNLDEIGFETRGLDSGKQLSGALSAKARFEETGHLTADGHASILPTFVDLAIHAEKVPLRPVQAYIDTFIRLDIVRGTADLAGRMQLGVGSDNAMTFSLRADGKAHDVVAADSASGDDFLRVATADAKGIDLSFKPDHFRLRSLDLDRASATVALGTDASLNLFRIFPALVPTPGDTGKAVPFVIDRIGIRKSTMRFLDHTVEPPFESRVDSIQGQIVNLSSSPKDEAHVTLNGRVNGTATAKVDARMRPADKEPYAIFTLDLSSYEMTALTPYLGKYVGHIVDRGQMSMSLDYKIAERRLKGQNNAELDQFTLGQKTGSRDATKLPVGLALALLRDREGRIKLDVPVEGNLDDPHFGIMRVVLHALMNLLVKAAASPFALLGKLIPGGGGGSDSLGTVTFAPGSDSLEADQASGLGKLAKALADRPGLRLYVTGVADSVVDRDGLTRANLERQIARSRRAEFFDAGVPEPDRAAEAPMPPGERARALARLYLKAFGKDSLGATLPDPNISKGDARRIAKEALAGTAPSRPAWPAKTPLAPGTEERTEARLLQSARAGSAELLTLAEARSQVMKHELVDVQALPEGRVFIKGSELRAEPSAPRVACGLELSD